MVFWAWWMPRPFLGENPRPATSFRDSLGFFGEGQVRQSFPLVRDYRTAASSRDIQIDTYKKWLKCRRGLEREVSARARERSSGGKMVREDGEGQTTRLLKDRKGGAEHWRCEFWRPNSEDNKRAYLASSTWQIHHFILIRRIKLNTTWKGLQMTLQILRNFTAKGRGGKHQLPFSNVYQGYKGKNWWNR